MAGQPSSDVWSDPDPVGCARVWRGWRRSTARGCGRV